MNLRTELIFPTPIWIFEDCPIDNDVIIDFIHKVKEEDPEGMKKSNEGGWQSNNFVPPYIDKTPFKDLHKQIVHNTYTAGDNYGFNDYTIRLGNLWCNINTMGNSNAVHTHSGSMFAGVYYAEVPNCCSGELKFHRHSQSNVSKNIGDVMRILIDTRNNITSLSGMYNQDLV